MRSRKKERSRARCPSSRGRSPPAGDVLVKEYVDDGYSGSLLNRPGLEARRRDVKTVGVPNAIHCVAAEGISAARGSRAIAVSNRVLGE
jgi:hypothetical protein